jgi:hypothetical protein
MAFPPASLRWIPQDEVELITHKNAEELFHFPLSQELIAAYSGSPT